MARCLAVLSLVLCSFANAVAAEVWDGAPFASDPKALLAAATAVKPANPDEGVIVLLDETIVTFDTKGRSTRVERLIYRVIDQSAVDSWATIETYWSPWYHARPEVDARVVTSSGDVHRLDPRSFGAADAVDEPDMFSDTRILSGPLPAVAPGAVIEQTVTYREKNPFYDAGVSERHNFGRWVETRQSRLVIEYPAEVELKLANRTVPRVEPKTSTNNGLTRVVFETGGRPALEQREWNVPADVEVDSHVAWATGKSWQQVARRYSAVIDERIGDTKALSKITAAAVAGATDRKEIAARLLAVISKDIRYAGVEFGEGSIFPRTPAETLKNKYGDCKDKATLLIAMLRQAGVPAHAALLRSGQGYDVDPDLPGLGHFDHVIVRVEGDAPFWIDPTDEFSRVAELPDADQGRLALVATPGTTALVRTPADESSANRTVETREFWLAEEGRARVTEVTEYFGSDERSLRRSYSGADKKATTDGLKEYVEQAYLAKSLGSWSVAEPKDLAKPFRLNLEAVQAKRGLTGGGEAAVGIFFSRLVSDFPSQFHVTDEERKEAEGKPRAHDFAFGKPFVLEVNYIIHPPDGYAVRALPEAEMTTFGSAKMTKAYRVADDGTVHANYRVDSGPRRITAKQFEEIRTAVTKINQEPPYLLYFDQIGRKHLEAGDVAKAIAEFRRLAGKHPREGLHRGDTARALLAAGLGEAARREARAAVKVDPKSASAHLTLGFVLSHDLVGRELRAGADVKGAIAAYRKAKELDPEHTAIRADLAVLLQHSNEGLRYADKSRLDEAINEYLELQKMEDVNNEIIERELMTLYAQRGRWDDLTRAIAASTDTTAKDLFSIIVAGATRGAEAALTASAAVQLATRREMQTQAGGILATLRHYPAAAELLGAAAHGSPNAAQLRMQADMLRKTVRHEEVRLSESDPQSVFKSAMLELLKGTSEEALNRRYATAEVAEVFADGDDFKRARKSSVISTRAATRQGAPVAMIADLALSGITFEQDGDENRGLRLRGRAPAAQGSDFTAYLVREGDSFRFAGDHESPAELALRALRLVEKNDLAGARQWLDWAREHVSGGGDDPLSSNPFGAIWTRGKAATADEARLAAAVLLPETRKSSAIAVPLLVAARDSAPADVQWRIDQALFRAYSVMEKWSDALVVAERLAAKFPDSGVAFQRRAFVLNRLERRDEARAAAAARLATLPGDTAALEVLGSDSLGRGAYDEGVKYFAQLLSSSKVAAGDLNDHAWASLFAEADLDAALDSATRAAAQTPDSHAILNTLAAVYAEQGKSSEARDTLLKSLEKLESDQPSDSDWYVIGRIAENYGVRDAAAEAYAKIAKPERTNSSVWELAQRRLKAMNGAK